ncbi:MAG: sigma-70 family RNA polymerase sigma factor [Chloroflexota bacterium]
MTAIPDALLLRRFREGDEASYEMLFKRHYDMVYGVLYRLTGTRQEAEDRAQEVFLKLYRYPLRHDQNVAGWLYRVAINTGYNALRAEQRRSARERIAARETEQPPHTEEEVTRREATRRVRAALAAIPPRAAKLLTRTGRHRRGRARLGRHPAGPRPESLPQGLSRERRRRSCVIQLKARCSHIGMTNWRPPSAAAWRRTWKAAPPAGHAWTSLPHRPPR